MPFSHQIVERQVSNLLGSVLGATMSAADTNYQAVASSSNRQNPDFPLTAIQDAIVNAAADLIKAIAETPRHPERVLYTTFTASLANRATLPNVDSVGDSVIGTYGRVYDAADNQTCLPVSVDAIRDFNRFSATVYNAFTPYWYVYTGQVIEHTRPNVRIEVCVFQRITYNPASNFNLRDSHEWALVCGAVAKLAPREALYMDLLNYCVKFWDDHVAQIRAFAAPDLMTDAQAAPTSV